MMLATELNWWTVTQGTVTIIVALMAATIAAFAYWANREKLRLDLYLRRFGLYKSLRKTVSEFDGCHDVKRLYELMLELEFARAEAAYMFSEHIGFSIDSVMHSGNWYISQLESHIRTHPDSLEDFEKTAQNLKSLAVSMDISTLSILKDLKPYLDFHDIGIREYDRWRHVKKVAALFDSQYRRLLADMERMRKV